MTGARKWQQPWWTVPLYWILLVCFEQWVGLVVGASFGAIAGFLLRRKP